MANHGELKFVPSRLRELKLPCDICGASISPDFLKIRAFPTGSIQGVGGHWSRVSIEEKCNKCNGKAIFLIPNVKRQGCVHLFGDEAYRKFPELKTIIYTYSVIGASPPILIKIEERIRELKSRLIPGIPEDSWSLHMKDIWSGDQRRRIPHYANWTKETTSSLFTEMERILSDNSGGLFKYNITYVTQSIDTLPEINLEEYVRNDIYISMVIAIIDDVTAAGGEPIIKFDSIKNAKSDIVIHEWAKKSFGNTQFMYLYPFITHGIPVSEPIFIPPASASLLEAADFMSFFVARYHFCMMQKKIPDIDLGNLGKVRYFVIEEKTGDLIWNEKSGFPFKMNYPK